MENTSLEYKIGQNENSSFRSAMLVCTVTAQNIPKEHQGAVLCSPCISAKCFEMESGGNDEYRSGSETEHA